jgi:branched-chain amino acid transport system substrate-binding protein
MHPFIHHSVLAGSFRTGFTGRGGRIVGYEAYAPGVRALQDQLARLISAGPDVIYMPGYVNEVTLNVREIRKLGFNGPLLGGDGGEGARLPRTGAAAVENAFYTTHCSRDDPRPELQVYVKKHVAKYKTPPDPMAILAYDAVHVLLEAINRAGTTEGPAVQDALRGTDFLGVSGPIRFDPQRNPRKDGAIIEIRQGRPVFRGVSTRL